VHIILSKHCGQFKQFYVLTGSSSLLVVELHLIKGNFEGGLHQRLFTSFGEYFCICQKHFCFCSLRGSGAESEKLLRHHKSLEMKKS